MKRQKAFKKEAIVAEDYLYIIMPIKQ